MSSQKTTIKVDEADILKMAAKIQQNNKEKAEKMLHSTGLQLPKENTFFSFNNSISYSKQNVKQPTKQIDKQYIDGKTEYYALNNNVPGYVGICAIDAAGAIAEVEPNSLENKRILAQMEQIISTKKNAKIVPMNELIKISRTMTKNAEKMPDTYYRIVYNLNRTGHTHSLYKMHRNPNSDIYAFGKKFAQGSFDDCNKALADILANGEPEHQFSAEPETTLFSRNSQKSFSEQARANNSEKTPIQRTAKVEQTI